MAVMTVSYIYAIQLWSNLHYSCKTKFWIQLKLALDMHWHIKFSASPNARLKNYTVAHVHLYYDCSNILPRILKPQYEQTSETKLY